MSGRVTLEESLERSDTVSTVCSISIPERIRLPPLLEHEAVYRGALECVAKANHIDEFFDHLKVANKCPPVTDIPRRLRHPPKKKKKKKKEVSLPGARELIINTGGGDLPLRRVPLNHPRDSNDGAKVKFESVASLMTDPLAHSKETYNPYQPSLLVNGHSKDPRESGLHRRCAAKCFSHGCDFTLLNTWSKRRSSDPVEKQKAPWDVAAREAQALCRLHRACVSAYPQ